MRKIEKKKMSGTTRGIIALSAVLAFLIILTVTVSLITPLLQKPVEKELPEVREELGEWLYNNTYTLAYERILESQIQTIIVSNEHGTFDMTRWPDESGVFWLGYTDESGEKKNLQYIPPILGVDDTLSYESLYAIEEGDGFGRMYVLSYLCSAIGTPYFTERIDLPTGKDEESLKRRSQLLKQYGLDGDKVNRVSFAYTYKDGEQTKEAAHHVEIGAQALSGAGYYYMVDGRDCVYYTATSSFKYALVGFNSFVRGMLISGGVGKDSYAAPLLTPGFKQWVNTVHKDGAVAAGSTVIASGDLMTPIKESSKYTPEKYPSGYEISNADGTRLELSALADSEAINRIKAALVGKPVGDYTSDPVLVTVLRELYESNNTLIDFGNSDSVAYTYKISAIESIIDAASGVESDAEGTPVSSNSTVKITYTYKVADGEWSRMPSHALLDLSSEKTPAELAAALAGLSVGELAAPIEVTVDYTKDTAISSLEKFVLSDIIAIYDEKGAAVEKATDTSYVSILYYEEIDGKRSEKVSLTVNLADLEQGSKWDALKAALVGKTVGKNLNTVVYSDTYYYEVLRDFYTFKFDTVDYFVTSELIVSFRFVNTSERDPFYGESFYENTLEGRYSLYGLDSNVCESVIKILGGVGTDGTTQTASGLSGKTVAVGLTSEIMEKYNLYDYTLYYELPSGIGDSEENPEDYTWDSSIGFTLYISREDPATGNRYVASDMYDLVAEVSGEKLEFLDGSFVDFWARRRLVLTDAANMTDFDISFYMEDVYGDYSFDITKRTVYIYRDENGKYASTYEYVEGAATQDQFQINVTEGEGSMKTTELSKYLERMNATASWTGGNTASMFAFYNDVMGGGEKLFLPNSVETVGASNYALAFQVIQSTQYQGTLTEEEQAAAFANGKLMSFRFKLDADNASGHYYKYDFYRLDDRRVMVSMYQTDEDGDPTSSAVSDFYLSTFSFKKIVANYLLLLDAKNIDGEIPYPDEMGK